MPFRQDHHEGKMDRFSAHLDRGWDLVQHGDSQGAELSARRALELNKQAPEAYNLLGYAAALRGDFEAAIRHYNHALSLDESYFEALLNAAEVLIHPLADYEEALEMCDRALELAETDDELVDALLLKFDALLGEDRMDEAKSLCARFPEGPFENPNHVFLVGRALYEVGDLERAAPLIEQAVKATPQNSEAWYYLGLMRDEQGDRARATQAFVKARALDLQAPTPDWSLSSEAFEHMARRVIETLPQRLRQTIRQDEIYVADMPGVEFVIDGVDPRALILMDDISPAGLTAPSARLFVYQRNLERLAGALEAVESELRAALERELTAVLDEQDPGELTSDNRKLLN
ncbi:MAG TPA: tetratricopeptide repeat protein [Polyangiaceae bacterium]|nr:tetratricopeptide repeat protein [Polyangiaceae bacterium]